MTNQLKADLMLLMVTLFWGISYLLTRMCLNYVDPLTLNSYRFIIAFFIAAALSFPKLKNPSKATIKYSLLLGFALTLVYISYGFGVKYTSLSNAGFLCALSVVMVPILGFIFKKQKPENKFIIVVIMCAVGIGLLTLNGSFKPALGDILSILCAVFYAAHMLIAETAVSKEGVNAFQIGVFQLGFTGLFTGILAFIFEKPWIPKETEFWSGVLILAIFCTGVAFIVQVLAQQYTTAIHVGVIFTLEPVFAGLVAFLVADEVLSIQNYIGAVILLCSLFVMEVDLKKLKIKKSSSHE